MSGKRNNPNYKIMQIEVPVEIYKKVRRICIDRDVTWKQYILQVILEKLEREQYLGNID